MDLSHLFKGTLSKGQNGIMGKLSRRSDKIRGLANRGTEGEVLDDVNSAFAELAKEVWSGIPAGPERYSAMHALRLAHAASSDPDSHIIFDQKLKECLLWCKMALAHPCSLNPQEKS